MAARGIVNEKMRGGFFSGNVDGLDKWINRYILAEWRVTGDVKDHIVRQGNPCHSAKASRSIQERC